MKSTGIKLSSQDYKSMIFFAVCKTLLSQTLLFGSIVAEKSLAQKQRMAAAYTFLRAFTHPHGKNP
ncbi:MAG: hypothetical protein EAZ92_09910 [Candidatus Kapaibacterium sp.]|nr:MAG: hypothetical protein EAZ92_09910 [Candidatus Kapabacteria bacterium]